MNRLSRRIEARCPKCSAPIVISAAVQGRKIQCPSCRQKVTVTVEKAPQQLEYRPVLETISQRELHLVEDAEVITRDAANREPCESSTPSDHPSPLLKPGHRLRWFRRSGPAAADASDEQEAILLHNLRAMGRRDITVEPVRADESGQLVVDRWCALFRAADWTVCEARPKSRPERNHGLVLAAGQCPLPHAATATYMALKAAGFPIIPRLDSSLGPEQAILIAGSFDEGAS
jgi:hypothetical protein